MAALFFVLTPGVLFTLPPKGKIYTVALVHALIFALIYYLSHNALHDLLNPSKKEPFYGGKNGAGAACSSINDCASGICTNNECE